MAELTDDQEIVLAIAKDWLIELDASFLAKEETVVYWGNLEGNIRKQGWVQLKLREAVNIIRSTRVPIGIMKLCTEDILRAAAQEEDRTYVAGCTVVGEVKDDYFNFHTNRTTVSEQIEHKIAIHLVAELEAMQENILWKDLAYLFEQALLYCKLPLPNAMQRNKFIRYGLNNTDFIEKRNTKTYNGRYVQRVNGKLKQYICIKLPHRSGVKEDWSREDMRNVILRAVKGIRK